MATLDSDGQHPVDPASVPSVDFPEFDDTAAAGDWGLFRRRCTFVDASPVIDLHDALTLKRRFSLAYLGNRAQAFGGVYMRARPSVFTPAFVERMAAENAEKRFTRYPWLQRLIDLLQQLDQDQYLNAPQATNLIAGQKRQHLHVVPTNNSFA